jgi:MscS family membrane protein
MATPEVPPAAAPVPPGLPELPFDWYRELGPTNQRWFWAVAGLAAVAAAVWLAGFLWRRVLVPLSRRTSGQIDNLILAHARRPTLALIAAGGLNALYHLVTDGTGFAVSVPGKITEGVLYAAVVLAVCWIGYAVVAAVSDWYLAEVAARTASAVDDKLVPIVRRLAKAVVLFIGLTVILGHFDVKIAALLGAAGVASLAVALAAQETVANMIAGFTILVDRPFRIGDRIQLADGLTGDVHEIGLRSTRILTFDHTLMILPNKEISGARIVNLSYPDPRFAIRRTIAVAYGTDLDRTKRLLLEIAGAHPKVLKDPAPDVLFNEFGDSALVLQLICFIADYHDSFRVIDELNMEVNRRFAREGIEIPFPQRDLHVRDVRLGLGLGGLLGAGAPAAGAAAPERKAP